MQTENLASFGGDSAFPAHAADGAVAAGVPEEVWQATCTTLGATFARVAQRDPVAPAVSDDSLAWNYGELANWTAHLVARLDQTGVPQGAVVAVLLPVGTWHIGAVLAIVRSGRMFLSLDPGYPEVRLRRMLASAGAAALVTSRALQGMAAGLGMATDLLVDDIPATGEAPDPGPRADPEAFAALYFTSGSTGEPKGVPHTHRNILFDIGRQRRDLGITPQDRFDLLFSPSFSAFLSPVFGALLSGASVHVLDLRRHPVERLRDWWNERRITVATLGVSTFRRLIGVLPEGRNFPHLRLLSLGAEPLRAADVAHFRERFGEVAVLQNALATTETRTLSQALWLNDGPAPAEVTMGNPVSGKTVRLLGEDGQPVPPGVIGEIEVTSVFISPGPWDGGLPWPGNRRPAPTPVIWRTGDLGSWSPEGELRFHGRRDDQLKVRGHRVEAGEVENCLLRHPAVCDAAVLVMTGAAGGADVAEAGHEAAGERLVALWVRQPGEEATWQELREHLRASLPEYAVPGELVEVGELPRTPTGKLARRQLPEAWRNARVATNWRAPDSAPRQVAAGGAAAASGAAGTAEAADPVAVVWWRALGREEGDEGSEDADFFASGGDSLAAAELLAAVGAVVGGEVPATWLLANPTLRAFRRRLLESPETEEPARRYRLQAAGAGRERRCPLYLFPPWNHRLVMFRDLATGEPGCRDLWVVEGRDESDHEPAGSIAEMAERMIERLSAIHPEGPAAVGGFSSGGYLAWEVARRWAAVERVYLLDCSRYHAALDGPSREWVSRTRTWPGRLRAAAAALSRPSGPPRWPLLHRLFLGKLDWWLRGRWLPRRDDPYAVAFARNIAINAAYAVHPVTVPVTLLRADDQGDWYNLVSPDLGWSPCCPAGLTIRTVPSNHPGLLRAPAAAVTRRWLQEA